jgi:hypothetical protein
MRYPAALLVLAGMLGAASPVWATSFTGAYAAGNTNANAAPPNYILRLDGVFGGGIATFNDQGVTMEILANGSARLFGTVAVGRPGAPDPAFGSLWDLDTTWSPAGMSASEQFFRLESGMLRNQADPLNDFIRLAHRGMPARVGTGVFPDGECVSTGGAAPCFGFAGWVSYAHHRIGGGNDGDSDSDSDSDSHGHSHGHSDGDSDSDSHGFDRVIRWQPGDVASFTLELEPVDVPEANLGMLVLVSAIVGYSRRRRANK